MNIEAGPSSPREQPRYVGRLKPGEALPNGKVSAFVRAAATLPGEVRVGRGGRSRT